MPKTPPPNPEAQRLAEDQARERNWKRWGPYLPERQWGTVREDYSPDGAAWEHFPFELAHQRAYRWGEDGLLGLTDRQGRLCFCPALWNGADPILKERLFGLSNAQGNHGEDVKELYYYLDSTPTHSYAKALYKYPQAPFPYQALLQENARRDRSQPEYELLDTGVFDQDRYFDLTVEYAKAGPDDLLIRLSATNRGPDTAEIQLLPKLWFRNTWIWGCQHEGCTLKPSIVPDGPGQLALQHPSLGHFRFAYEGELEFGLAENETDTESLYGTPNYTPHTKSAFHKWIAKDQTDAVSRERGTMAMLRCAMRLGPGETRALRLRLSASDDTATPQRPFDDFDAVFQTRIEEANTFYSFTITPGLDEEESSLQRQAYAGLLWTKQFYHYSVADWLRGDPAVGVPPATRLQGRNRGWNHLFNRDVISMPDKWEYPWYAAWDTAFHMIPFAAIDIDFAKQQLILFLREWYLHPNGQIPAYEWALDDVNPPTHPWACWQVYQIEARRGAPDVDFLKRVFCKLLLNFTWWVNRKDPEGNNLFGGGFLGLDNIGLFDRSQAIPGGATLQQADGTAWMAFYSATMLAMALELSRFDPTYEDIASKFFEHYMSIADAINHFGETGLWDEDTGFYYDEVKFPNGHAEKVKVRSLIGLIPMLAVQLIDPGTLAKLPRFRKRMDWYLEHRRDITAAIGCRLTGAGQSGNLLLAIPTEERLRSLLRYLFDESEFLSPYGIRSLSKRHQDQPFSLDIDGASHQIAYTPGDSDTYLFGGNSNWRGPIWLPLNYLIVEALQQYHAYYGDTFTVEYPAGSGEQRPLAHCATDIERRLACLFLKNAEGQRPYAASHPKQSADPHFGEMHQFFEYFNGDSGQGHGASHQTGWTALIATLLDKHPESENNH